MKTEQDVLKCIALNEKDMSNIDFGDDEDPDFDAYEWTYNLTDGKEFHNLESKLNTIVTYMPNNVEVYDAFCFRNNLLQFCVLAFSNGDVKLLKETQGTVEHERTFTFGGFLDKTYSETVYGCEEIDIPANPISDSTTKFIVHQKDVGIFRKKMEYSHSQIIIGYRNGETVQFCIEADASMARFVYDYILKHVKKYADKKEEKKADSEEKKSDNGGSNIAEIRKLYEDGIITRDEMLDLIKNSK